MRTLEYSGQPWLLAFDFDGTTNLTSDPAPNGATVDTAYAEAIGQAFGTNARDDFLEGGGHNHRNPSEIVRAHAPHLSLDAHKTATRDVVNIKLEVLLGQVGQPFPDGSLWPRFTDGFVDLWSLVGEARSVNEPIGTAVLSNGHTSFIQKTFDMLGLENPDMLITDDLLKAMALNLPLEELTKPSPFMFDLARGLWTQIQRRKFSYSQSRSTRELYAGDSEVKDSGLARQAGVDFVLIETDSPRLGWQRIATTMGLGSLSITGVERV